MSVREAMNQKPWIIGAAVLIVVVLMVWLFTFTGSRSEPSAAFEGKKAWFTIDDGKSWVALDAEKAPPFEYQGKQAVMCMVYKTPSSEPWAAYLVRYTPEGKRIMEKQGRGEPLSAEEVENRLGMIEVKRPGGAEWVRIDRPAAVAIQEVRAPAGVSGSVEKVEPNS